MSIIYGILVLLCAAAAAVVLLSYAFAWCEYANARPEAMKKRFAPRALWLATRLILLETASLILNLLQHPLGWYSPRERPPQAPQGTPVLLLHGLFLNRACWYYLRLRLRLRGFRTVCALNLPPWKDVESLTERVSKKVDELRHATGIEKVHLVGHSMGGIIARNYLQIRGGALKVEHCVLLGTPNHGSRLAPFAVSPLGELLLPGSEFLRRLAEAPLPAEARLINIYSSHENLVLPADSAQLAGAENIQLSGMGHHGLLYHFRSVRAVLDALQQEGGVTTIEVASSRRSEMIDISSQVRTAVAASGISSGLAVIFVPHTTAAVTINENADPAVVHDMLRALEGLVPWEGDYRHGEGNSAAHLKSTLVGASATVLVDNGAPLLGTWQGIYLCEFDGPRRRRVHIRVMPG